MTTQILENTKRLTEKQEAFAVYYFEMGNATQAAIRAGYAPSVAGEQGSYNLTLPYIAQRIAELRQPRVDAAIASIEERKKILSEIARGRITDFVETKDGRANINIGLEGANSAAIQEVTTDEFVGTEKRGLPAKVVTKLKLHNPMQAIDLLCKIDGSYAPEERNVNLSGVAKLVIEPQGHADDPAELPGPVIVGEIVGDNPILLGDGGAEVVK